MMNGLKVVLPIIVLSALLLMPEYAAAKSKPEFQKGICYATWAKNRYMSAESDESLKELAKTGAAWVALTVNWYQDECDTTDIFSTIKTASDSSLIHAIEVIHSLGMKVLLKPHLDLVDVSSGGWRGQIACTTEPDWGLWFKNYANFILHYAQIAQKHKVEMFCIGTELTNAVIAKEKLWRTEVIAPIRKIYKGPITYAANWDEEYSQVGFWDALDYVGIDAYFPLSEADNPNLADIRRGWEVWVKDIEKLQAKVKKPVIFPEVGYCSAVGTASTPWAELTNTTVDLELQADCYRALFKVFWEKKWFYGVYWWRWGTDVRFGGSSNKGHSFQNKPAQGVVTEWYGKKRQAVKGKY